MADLEIMADGIPLERKKIDLVQGVNNVDFEVAFSTENMIKLTAQLYYPSDILEENNRAESTLWVDQKPRLLLVSSKENDHKNFIEILIERGFTVDHALGGDLSGNADFFDNFDLVFLSNVAKENLSDDSMNALMRYVRDLGGGVVFAAGEKVFGDNGYSGTPIEDFLPAEFKARERKKDLALVIAIDRSYSMKGRKIEYAKEASRAALELLEEQHKFAVVAFDSQPYISVPMRMVRSKRRAEDRISRIKASGQTNIYPALGVVYRLLDRESSVAKHVILLSDGDTHPADFEKLLRRIRDAGIIVSTVTIGKTGDPKLMEKIANWGGGQNYVALSAEAIPQIFIEETQKALKSSDAGEKISTQLAMNVRAFSGIEFNEIPDLSGLISTKLRDTADSLLSTGDGEPLLSRWQYGLGKTVLFSSTASGRWAKNWLGWADYGKFWDQVIRQTMKNPDIRSKRLVLSSRGEKTVAKIVLLNEKGEFRDNLSPVLIVGKEDGTEVEKLSLQQVGPGYYEVDINEEMSRPALLSLSPEGGVGLSAARFAGVVALNPTFSEELRTLPPNLPLLREIARISGGKLSPEDGDIYSPDDRFGSLAFPLLPWLVGFALLLFFVDIYMRRSPFIWKALGRKS